jgi:hypothetical protein
VQPEKITLFQSLFEGTQHKLPPQAQTVQKGLQALLAVVIFNGSEGLV